MLRWREWLRELKMEIQGGWTGTTSLEFLYVSGEVRGAERGLGRYLIHEERLTSPSLHPAPTIHYCNFQD